MVRRYWGAFSAPEYRRFFVSTHNSLKSLLVFKWTFYYLAKQSGNDVYQMV